MREIFTRIIFSIFICISTTTFAQNTATDSSLEAGEIEQFKDWALRCVPSGNNNNGGCRLFQRLVLEENKKVVLQAMIVMPEDLIEPANIVFILPLGLHLPSGVKLKVDSSEPVNLSIQRCFAQGCTVRLPLNKKMLGFFKAGNVATVSVRERIEQEVNLRVSLAGFSAGFRALVKAETALRQ